MENPEENDHRHGHSGKEQVGSSYVEITLGINETSSLELISIKEVNYSDDQSLLKKPSSSSSSSPSSSSRIKQVSQELKRLAGLLTQHPEPPPESSNRTPVAQALKGLRFTGKTIVGSRTWDDVMKQYSEIVRSTQTRRLPPLSCFAQLIGMKGSEDFASLLLDVLDRRMAITREDPITIERMREYWAVLTDPSFDTQLQIFFDMVDRDKDGRISEDDIKEIITLSASANTLSRIKDHAGEYAKLIMEELDPYNFGYIMIENLETLLPQGDIEMVRDRDEIRKLSKMLSEKLKPTQDHYMKMCYRDLHYFVLDNWQRIWVMGLWIGAMVALFAYKYVQYRNKYVFEVMGHCVCMAKGAAETLKLNMALILLPVCRNTITWLRNKTRLGLAVPFDDNLNFHQAIAIAIGLGVGIHGISHLTCDFPRILSASPQKYEPLEPYFGEVQPTSYWQFVKGWEGITGIIMVVLMAIAFTLASPWFRRSRVKLPKPLNKLIGFNAFWYSHHLFIIVYTLFIIHGIKLYLTHDWYKKTTWMYVAVPITLYAFERLVRSFRSRVMAMKEYKVVGYPGALALYMSKPDRFKYKSGQYIFVKCAAVSPFEWHPFSITSAPGDDYLSVHIRGLGDWTEQLRTVFEKNCLLPETEKSGTVKPDHFQDENNPDFPRVLIDGPYGAPTQDYKDYEVVLLVGLGIGVTPMISVVKDIINNIKTRDEEENTIEEGRTSVPRGRNDFKTRRAYFYWMTGEQDSFDWFKDVMNEVAEMDHRGVIEMHNHCTSVYEQGDARSTLITMIQSINHAKNGVDIVSGTRVKAHFASPNWRTVYKTIALKHPNRRVGVFYCGLPAAVRELRHLASEFSHKTNTKFEFHKQNF